MVDINLNEPSWMKSLLLLDTSCDYCRAEHLIAIRVGTGTLEVVEKHLVSHTDAKALSVGKRCHELLHVSAADT